jgi:hypothetical protein
MIVPGEALMPAFMPVRGAPFGSVSLAVPARQLLEWFMSSWGDQ